MTDKTPQNKADIPMNTPTAPAGTTDATRNSGPESRALPEAGALKDRFKAGSIPLQTDFADLIDLANMGRQAVGGAEGQTGPADGFTLSSMGRLELKPNTHKGINVNKDGVAVKVNTKKGLNVDNDGVYLPLGYGLRYGDAGLDVTCTVNGGLQTGFDGTSVIPGNGITVDSSGIGVKAGEGITVNDSGVAVKVNTAKGLEVKSGGIEINDGVGIQFDPSGQLSLYVKDDGGINRGPGGAHIISGNGITVDSRGVGVKAGNGIIVNDSGVAVNAGKGISVDQSGVYLPLGLGVKHGGEGLDVLCKEDGGLNVDSNGVAVKVNTAKGLIVTSEGVEINDGVGIQFDPSGQLSLDVSFDGGISRGPGGAHIISGNGIAVVSSGVHVKLAKGSFDNGGGGQGSDGTTSGNAGGLSLNSYGLSVDAGKGIQIDPDGVSIKLAANSNLAVDQENGLRCTLFSPGMMMMFSGDVAEVPEGWALCDGNKGTPNLLDRSIIGNASDVVDKEDIIYFIMKM
ncbi:hypothetical protein [Enterobacter sp. UPMP2052]